MVGLAGLTAMEGLVAVEGGLATMEGLTTVVGLEAIVLKQSPVAGRKTAGARQDRQEGLQGRQTDWLRYVF